MGVSVVIDRVCYRGHLVAGKNKKTRTSNPSYAACRECERLTALERAKRLKDDNHE